jgi:Terminase large subunit, ATPase domain
MIEVVGPLDFFAHLVWLDGRPLLDTIEPYRRAILREALYSFEADGRLRYNLVLAGRGKKNWKSADLILASFYRLFVWPSAAGNDVFLLASDEGQAADDLKLAKKLIQANPILAREVQVKQKEIERLDGRGVLQILPAGDVGGSHGKTYSLVGFDEIHTYRTWDLLEALAPDPTRPDALTWVTSYDTIYNAPGVPLYDLKRAGQAGTDPRMLFSWYSGDLCTDPAFALLEPEERANPSIGSWPDGRGYLEQQRRRLPTSKFRRLHLNLPGAPDGAFFDAANVMGCIVPGRRRLAPRDGISYLAFVDMSGGSSDDAVLAIGHVEDGLCVIDLVVSQGGGVPFDPRLAVVKFVALLREYRISRVIGDKYAGETFLMDFRKVGVGYEVSRLTKSQLYEAMEPRVNAGEVELPDEPKVQEQLLTLVRRGARVDHQPGDHDDWANAVAGLVNAVLAPRVLGPAIW